MSNKNKTGSNNNQHNRQPIHLYHPSRHSIQSFQNYQSSKGYTVSPSKYSNRDIMSPSRLSIPIILHRNPELSLKVEKPSNQANSSYKQKYTKLSSKIQVLQNNLNRLNGQHQSLKKLFQKSQLLSKKCQVFWSMDKLKQKIQQSKIKKFIQQKRYLARCEVACQQYFDQFAQLETQLFVSQGQKIYNFQKLSKKIQQTNRNQTFIKIQQQVSIRTKDTAVNIEKFIKQIDSDFKKYSQQLVRKLQVQKAIQNERDKVHNEVQKVKIKLGQLKCITEYEIFLEKEYFIKQELTNIEIKASDNQRQNQQEKMKALQLRMIKNQITFVGSQSIDRLNFQLASIDAKFVEILRNYEAKKHKQLNYQKNKKQNDSDRSKKLQQGTNKTVFDNIDNLDKKIQHLNFQYLGLKKYLQKSEQRTDKLQGQINKNRSMELKQQFQQFLQSIKQIGNNIHLLSTNVQFFKNKCSQQ